MADTKSMGLLSPSQLVPGTQYLVFPSKGSTSTYLKNLSTNLGGLQAKNSAWSIFLLPFSLEMGRDCALERSPTGTLLIIVFNPLQPVYL